MSNSVDERVVSMQFDNRQFERGVGTTLKSLDKLKKGLNLEESAKGLEHLSRAGRNFSLDHMAATIDKISSKFSGMGMVGMMEFQKIANAALNAGNRIARSLTIEPITEGYKEYELKMGSVQTIMASTGESIGTVNGYLEELNEYSDRTIYSFADMTSNIGKFTNAGVKLEDAVNAIKGISNEAALSGANANEASRAMYNFSQALSSGAIRLIDWKSIENANMATKEFKQELINTAVAMGTLKSSGNGLYKAQKQEFNATKSFNDSLQEQWMTSEVLVKTLERYSDETTDIGKRAYAAAQDIKTYSQLMDTIKESIGSGWAQISELVFGDLEEAKRMWTDVGKAMGDAVSGFFDPITEYLGSNLNSEYKKFLSEGPIGSAAEFEASYEKAVADRRKPLQEEIDQNNQRIISYEEAIAAQLKYQDRLKEKAENGGWFINDQGQKQWDLPEPKPIEDTAEAIAELRARNEELNKSFEDEEMNAKDVRKALLNHYNDTISAVARYTDAGYSYEEALKKVGVTQEKYTEMLEMRNDILTGKADIEELTKSFNELSGRDKIITAIGNSLKYVGAMLSPVKDAFKEVFFGDIKADGLSKFADRFYEFSMMLKPNEELLNNLSRTFKGLFSLFDIGRQAAKSLFKSIKPIFGIAGDGIGTILDFTAGIGDSLVELDDLVKKSDTFGKIFKTIIDYVSPVTKAIVDFGKIVVNAFQGLNFDTIFGFIGKGVTYVTDKLVEFFGKAKNAFNMSDLDGFDILNAGVFSTILIGVKKVVDVFKGFAKDKESFIDGVKDAISGITDTFGELQNTLRADTLSKIAKAIAIMAGSLFVLSLVDTGDLATALIGLASTIGGLYIASNALMGIFEKFKPTAIGKMAAGINSIATAVLLMSASMLILSTIDGTGIVKGVVAIGGLLTAIYLFSKYSSKNKLEFKSIDGIKSMAFAMIEFAVAMKIIAGIDIAGIGKSLLSIGVILAMIWALSKYTVGGASLIGVGIGMGIIAGALIIMAGAMKVLSMLSIKEIGVSLLAMAGALAAMAIAANAMILAIPGAIAMGIMAGALLLLVPSLMLLGSMSLSEIGKSLLALSVALVAIGVASTGMILALPGAFAMLVMSKAILMLIPSLVALGKLSLKEIGKSLLSLAGAFLVIGVGATLLGVVSPLILAAGAAIAVLGVGLMSIGAGVALFATGMATLAVSGEVGAKALVETAKSIIGIIPAVAVAFGEGLIAIAGVIIDGAPIIGAAITSVIVAVVTTIADSAPVLVDGGLQILTSILMGIANNIGQLLIAAGLVIVNFLDGLGAMLPMVIQAGVDLMVNFINGMANGIRDNAETVYLAVGNLLSSIIEMSLTGIQLLVEKIPGIGDKMAAGLESAKESIRNTLTSEEMTKSGANAVAKIGEGVQNGSSEVAKAGGDMAGVLKGGFEENLLGEGGISESLKAAFTPESLGMEGISDQLTQTLTTGLEGASGEIKASGKESAGNYSTGIKLGNSKASSAGATLAGAGVTGSRSKNGEFHQAGLDTANGFAKGMKDGVDTVSGAAAEMAQAAIDAAKRILDSHSPSKVFMTIGDDSDEGMAIGLTRSAKIVANSASNVGIAAIDGIRSTISKFSTVISDNIDPNPTIRPVLDLSNIRSGSRMLGAMLSDTNVLSIGTTRGQVSAISAARGEGKYKPVEPEKQVAKESAPVTYIQNNYSPKALSRIEIYRQTKNQISQVSTNVKGVVKRV